MATTTSTSSTSSTSSSISSTSSSISSTSSSISSTSASTSSTSSSISTSSTSSSISSTSSSISSTSSSSTSSSTSISSTSSSISSTSFSSTSMSSTSSSSSISSTSSSISSTSSSYSSTSISWSSTSISLSSTSSSTSTTTVPAPYIAYSYADSNILPAPNTALANSFNSVQVSNTMADDGDYYIQYGSEYMVQEFKKTWTKNTDVINIIWNGRSTISTIVSTLYLQIYNVNSGLWETLASENRISADTDFTLKGMQQDSVSNYYDATLTISLRIYQRII